MTSDVAPTLDEAVLARAERILGKGPVGWAIEHARAGLDLAVELNLEDEGLPVRVIRHACEETLLEFSDEPAERLGLSQPQREVIHDAVLRGIPVDRLVATARHLQQSLTTLLLDEAVAVDPEPSMLRDITLALARRVDLEVDAIFHEYAGERERVLSGVKAQRRNTVAALVRGAPADEVDARTRLGLDLDLFHVGLVLSSPGDRSTTDESLQIATRAVERALDARITVRHEAEDGAWWVWASSVHAPDTSGLRSARLGVSRACVAVGSPQPGAVGFRRTYLEALDAQRFAGIAMLGPVVFHDDVALASLLCADPERAGWFVHDRLGRLASVDPAMTELRTTLRCYYRSNMRPATAAQEMHLHRNTLMHRLHRIEQLLGHGVNDKATELQCALLLVDALSPVGAGAEPGSPAR